MPIRPEWIHFYGAEWRKLIRPRILARDGYRCTACGREMGKLYRNRQGKAVVVQLGIAHLNHDPADSRDSVLATLCRACHLRHDAPHHAAAAHLTRAPRKDAARPLLA